MPTPAEIKAWLDSLPHIHDTQAGRLTLSKQTWPACQYTATYTAPDGARNPGNYERTCIYAAGAVPKLFLKGHHCFTLAGDSEEWYVSSYMLQQHLTEAVGRFHPFGLSFQVSAWPAKFGKIDDDMPRPYKRHHMIWEPDEA